MTAVPLVQTWPYRQSESPMGGAYRSATERAGMLPPGLAAEEVGAALVAAPGRARCLALPASTKARRASATNRGTSPQWRQHPVAWSGGRPAGGVQRRSLAAAPLAADLAALAPMYVVGGAITAANMAAEGDGAAGLLIASPQRARDLGLSAKAVMVSFAVAGGGPEVVAVATIAATSEALRRAGLVPTRWGVSEVHESRRRRSWRDGGNGSSPERVNPEGGALGHDAPLGAASGLALCRRRRRLASGDARYALVCLCGEGGCGDACVLEERMTSTDVDNTGSVTVL